MVGGSDFYVAGKWESNLNQTSERGFNRKRLGCRIAGRERVMGNT